MVHSKVHGQSMREGREMMRRHGCHGPQKGSGLAAAPTQQNDHDDIDHDVDAVDDKQGQIDFEYDDT
jgi:hypothetical protein